MKMKQVLCRLPFDPERNDVNVFQGFHGPYSHGKGLLRESFDTSYALDFSLPVGTIVRAARDGIVRGLSLQSDWFYEGVDLELGNGKNGTTNFIILEHGENEFSLYSHLAKNTGLVRYGQKIFTKQPLALTGLSGWVGPEPHLHFQMYEWIKENRTLLMQTIPFLFEDYDGPLEHEEIMHSSARAS